MIRIPKKKTIYRSIDSLLFCGASGIRTRVQTRNTYAFYTLISAFIFDPWQDLSHQPRAYLLRFRSPVAARANYSVYFRTA